MTQPVVPLRALSVGDLFDGSLTLFRRHFGTLAGLSVLAFLPVALIGVPIQIAMNQALQSAQPDLSGLTGVFVAIAAIIPIYLFLFDVSFGAILYAAGRARLGDPVTIGAAFRHGLRRFWRLLAVQLLWGLAVTLLWVTIIGIPFGIYLSVLWAFVQHAVVLDDSGVFEAFGRSRALVRGMWWRTFGIALLFLLFISVLGAIIGIPLGIVVAILAVAQGPEALQSPAYVVVSVLSNLLGSAITTPLMYTAWVLYYYDLRVRKEGLDLALRTDQMARAAPATGPTA